MNRSHKSVAVASLAVVEVLDGGVAQTRTARVGGTAITNMTMTMTVTVTVTVTVIDFHSGWRRNAWTSQ